MYPFIVTGVPVPAGGVVVIAGVVAGALEEVAAAVVVTLGVVDAGVVEAALQPLNPSVKIDAMTSMVKINGKPFIDFLIFICLLVKR